MGINNDRKKPEHLIEIFRNCKRKDVGLVIVGSGLNEKLKSRINSANTIYMGEVQDSSQYAISRIFRMADVFSIPGHVGLGINQAFYFGLPVVTEEGGQPPEISYLKNGQNGFLVPDNDITGLEEKIFYLIDNNSIRRKFSNAAQKDILQCGSVENMFNGFYQCVQYMTARTNKF
jgi:glycosyltransferase involved in cell wall biosynthesis